MVCIGSFKVRVTAELPGGFGLIKIRSQAYYPSNPFNVPCFFGVVFIF